MRGFRLRSIVLQLLLALVVLVPAARAQVTTPPSLPAEVARFGYADMILINGKVVSMDDRGINDNPGTIHEAMAIKGSRIMALGTTARIRNLANENTQVYELNGLTVLPGIIESHAHLFGGGQLGAQMGLPTPQDRKSTRLNSSH